MTGIDEKTIATYYGSRIVYDASNELNNANGIGVFKDGVMQNAEAVYWSDRNCNLYLVWKKVQVAK